MNGQGRPLRFLAAIGVGWIGMRTLLLWSATGSLPEAIREVLPLVPAHAAPARVQEPAVAKPPVAVAAVRPAPPPGSVPRLPWHPRRDPVRVQFAMLGLVQYGEPQEDPLPYVAPRPVQASASASAFAPMPVPSRWSGSGWFVVRAGTGLGVAPGASQLGGGQAGMRIAYALGSSGRFALAGRLSTPLAGSGREASLGIEWKPLRRLPLRLVAGQRFGLDGARGGPELGAIAGLERRIGSFRLESYGQAGAIARRRIEPYADGAARLVRPVARRGGIRIELGLGVWGAAQREAARLDVGPSLGMIVPLGPRQWRLALDWRQRVAGDARPGSGAALSLGTDF